jgi:DNA topoisomerase-3
MERGRLARDTFMREIAEVAQRIVERAKNYQSDTVPGDYSTLSSPCPKCGGVVQENYKRFACTRCDFSIGKHPGGRTFEIAEVEQLLRERTLGPLQGFRSRLGRPFAAILKISPEFKLEFDFGQSRAEDEGGEGEAIDFSGQEPLGGCPKCGSRVFEHGMSYVCEHAVGAQRSCDFRSGKIILQQEVARAQMSKLLAEGRTDLLAGFVSSRTRRKFKAYLVRGKDGKIGFEFEPRPARGAAGKAAAPAEEEAGAQAAGSTAGSGKPAAARAGGARKAVAPAKSGAVGATATAKPKAKATKAAKAAPRARGAAKK